MAKELTRKLSNKDAGFLKLAENIASSSSLHYKHGAVIVKGGSVISTGINKFKNHPSVIMDVQKIHEVCHTHAEIDALRKAGNVKGATIYVARINKQGKTRMSRPCNNCYSAIIQAGINKIVYTD